MCVCIYTHMCVCVCVCVYTHTYIYTYIYACVCVCVCVCNIKISQVTFEDDVDRQIISGKVYGIYRLYIIGKVYGIHRLYIIYIVYNTYKHHNIHCFTFEEGVQRQVTVGKVKRNLSLDRCWLVLVPSKPDTNRHTDTQTHRHTDTQTDRQTDTHTHTHTHTHTFQPRVPMRVNVHFVICFWHCAVVNRRTSSSLKRGRWAGLENTQAHREYAKVNGSEATAYVVLSALVTSPPRPVRARLCAAPGSPCASIC